MFRTPILRLSQTNRRFIKLIPESITNQVMSSSRPTGLIANSGLELLTFQTPNGFKVSILLEELKEAYGKDYVYQSINIMENIQKESWFTKLGPNGRIPVLVDHDKGGLAIQEGSAILSYLTRQYDPENRFHFTEDPQLSYQEQWVAWQHGGLGPMQGQANHFFRLAKERIPYPTQRYIGESERLYGILDHQLSGKEYLVGNKYTIADIANFSWVNIAYFSGVDLSKFKNLEAWWQRINDRAAVKKGLTVPVESQLSNAGYLKKLKEDPEFKQKHGEITELANKAKEQYGYKYSSP